MRVRGISFPSALALGALAACARPPAGPAALEAVAPLSPTPPPAWIAETSPRGTAQPGAQVRVRFASDAVPLEALEAPETQHLLSHFSIAPAVAGRFVLLTPRMVGFVSDGPLPSATRFRITLDAGVGDLAGHALTEPYAWTFATSPVVLENLPGPENDDALVPVGERPVAGVDSTVPLDPASLLAHASFVPRNGGAPVAAAFAPTPSPAPSAGETIAPGPASDETTHYDLEPVTALAHGTSYEVRIAAGVAPARGNLPTATAYSGKLRTYGDLTFAGIDAYGDAASGGGGRFAGGAPRLRFSNPIDAKSLAGAIAVNPSPEPGVQLAAVDDDGSVRLSAYALRPGTSYAIDVAASLRDAFGQSLGKPVRTTFATTDALADVWAPTGFAIFPTGAGVALNVDTTNLPDGRYRFATVPIAPERLATLDPADGQAVGALLPDPASWAVRDAVGPSNATSTHRVPLVDALHGPTGMFAYGVTARTFRARDEHGRLAWQEPQFTGVVQVTNVGLFAQWFPQSGLVRAHHLRDGSPVANAAVSVYEIATPAPSPAAPAPPAIPCATGRTDGRGEWRLDASAFARCASTAPSADQAPSLLVVAREGTDWTSVRTAADSGAYGGDFYAGWSAGTPNAHGVLAPDRDLYQPGETAHLAGIAYFETNGVLARARSTSFAVALHDPNGTTRSAGTANVDAFGAFSLTIPLAADAPLGYYEVVATGSDAEVLEGSFRVATFKPPNFAVHLKLDRDVAVAGTSVHAATTSTYLFGAPVEGGRSAVTVTRRRATFAPDGWDAFTFGRSWYGDEEAPEVDGDVLQRESTVGADGTSTLDVPVSAGLPYAMTYDVESRTADVSNLAVSDTASFLAVPGDALVGLSGAFVAQAATPFDVRTIVVDPHGHALAGRHVSLVLQRREFPSAVQLVDGAAVARTAVHYVDVARAEAVTQTSPQRVSLTASEPGSYRVHATVAGGADATAADLDVFVSGAGEAAWNDSDPLQATVKLDKPSYRPGDEATALVESPFPEAELAFAVVRHDVLYRTTQTVRGGAPVVRFRVTADMLPNAAVEAVLVRRGPPLAPGTPATSGALARVGFEPFGVAFDAKRLRVALVPHTPRVLPGGTEEVTVKLADAAGKPVEGEAVVAVVNDAILQLTGYRFPDVAAVVYASQPISTRWADNRADVVLQTPAHAVEKGFGFGGGALAGPGGTRVRTNFAPLAYWNAHVRTGKDGVATVVVTVPDDLTTWRAMAMAATADARFGSADATFIATKPLVTNPLVPQFVRPGDRFDAGVSLANLARASGSYHVTGALGGGIAFASPAPASGATSAPATSFAQAVRFPMVATGTEAGTLRFDSVLGGESDAFAVTLPVETASATESVVTTGVTVRSAQVPLEAGAGARTPLGGLDVTLASTLLGDVSEPAARLSQAQPPFATDLAARAAVAADTLLLDGRYGGRPRDGTLRATLQHDLAALQRLALPSGGFAPWPGATHGETFSTAFVAVQLAQARAAGIDVARGLATARGLLEARLADPSSECGAHAPDCTASVRLEALETFALLGDARTSFLADVYAARARFSVYERVELARLLVTLPAWRAQGLALRDELTTQLYETGRRASFNVAGTFGETPVEGQAQMLALLVETHAAPDRVDKALTSLLAMRTNGTWGCVCDDAEAMNALVVYAAASGAPPDFTATATLPGTTFFASFHGSSTTVAQRHVAGAALPSGRSTLVLAKTGPGTLHYTAALRSAVPPNGPGAYAGLRVDRTLRAPGSSRELARAGLAVPAEPVTVAAARVFAVDVTVTTDHPLDDVVIEDPLPAGFEAVDETFATAPTSLSAGTDNWELDYRTIGRDRVTAFAHHLAPGVYALHYLVRSVTPGTYAWPGARASLQYAPEEFGRTAATQLVVTP